MNTENSKLTCLPKKLCAWALQYTVVTVKYLRQLSILFMLLMFQACMAGILFAKFTKPSMRAETFMFSKVANLILTKSHDTALENYFYGL